MPISRLQYQREINLGRSDFSSLAFQIEICHMQDDITDLCNQDFHDDEEKFQRINEADSKICDFLRRIPRWKMEVGELFGYYNFKQSPELDDGRAAFPMFVLAMPFSRSLPLTRHLPSKVDPSGRPDQVLFDAVAWAHM